MQSDSLLSTSTKRLSVAFVTTSMPVGGAETLLVNLVRKMDHIRFAPQLVCMKELGPLGIELAREIPVSSHMLTGKYDLRVLPKLTRFFRESSCDAVITVGAGDKMFWGRLAAKRARVPVVASALHSTGWPDCIGRLNRLLTPWTDAFIGVAQGHTRHLIEGEGFPASKVWTIPNGVDTSCFQPQTADPQLIRALGLREKSLKVGIIAALRPEKDHRLFLEIACKVGRRIDDVEFLIVGDGPERQALEQQARRANLGNHAHFLGTRSDIPQLLPLLDCFMLTSKNEANPVSIIEAMGCGIPVIAPDVGSIRETVKHGQTGYVVPVGDLLEYTNRLTTLLTDRHLRDEFGRAGRQLIEREWSLDRMVRGYQDMVATLWQQKTGKKLPWSPPSRHDGRVLQSFAPSQDCRIVEAKSFEDSSDSSEPPILMETLGVD